jgi:hypothetical protein
MPTIELTHAQLGHLYDASERGIQDLDEQLGDYREEQFYSAADWAKMRIKRDRWARVLSLLANAIEETANAND